MRSPPSKTPRALLFLLLPLLGCGDQVVGWPDSDVTTPPDHTAPIVIATAPLAGATNVARNTAVAATFSEAMAPASLNGATFTLRAGATAVPGVVTTMGVTATFTPSALLAENTVYTATITTGATDLAGTAIAGDYVWTFTTGLDLGPTVIETSPEDLAIAVPVDADAEATFSGAMDPLTLSETSFLVTGPGGIAVLGTVTYDEQSMTAIFTPDEDLLEATTYDAEITTEAADLAGTSLEESYLWSFTTAGEPLGGAPVELGSLSTFVAVAGAGLTNSNSAGVTTLGGDVGLYPTATCLGDGVPCTLDNPVITGTLYAADPEGIASQAKTDLTAAYVDATSRPPGTPVNDISGMTLQPGVYTSGSTMSIAVDGVVTLDGMGDANAVWIFQIGSSLTVNNNAQVILTNGAQAKNVFWAVFSSSTLGSNVQFVGSVLAGASNSVGTNSVVVGRLLSGTGQITLLSNTITLPPN